MISLPIGADAAPAAVTAGERPASPPPPSPASAVAQQVEWLAQQGGGTARLRLSPASLGEIEVEVRLEEGRVNVVVRTREHAAQLALGSERSAVAQLFAARDLRVADFLVMPMAGSESAEALGSGSGGPAGEGGQPLLRDGRGSFRLSPASATAERHAASTVAPADPHERRLDVRV